MKQKHGHVTYMNRSFDFKNVTLKLLTVGCLLGVTGCGVKHKEYQPEQPQEPVEIHVDESNDTNTDSYEEKRKESLEQYVSCGESENPLKLLVVYNSTLEPLHFGYFRREKEIDEDKKTIYKAYFDDVLTGEEIDLGKYEQENEFTRYYYQLASRYLESKMVNGKIQKQELQNFVTTNHNELVINGEYYHTFADYDIYPITAKEVAHNVVAGSLYTNEVEEDRKTK